MSYFAEDSQLRDILVTGGDALMSSVKSLEEIFDAVYEMAIQKKENNKRRDEGDKYAEILRVHLGTRLPVYLPQRITPELLEVLKNFKKKAKKIGIQQFVIQTHVESPMEITPEMRGCVRRLLQAGWMVTNQHVYTAAASRLGHNAKLRKTLNEVGVLPYYTFTVKGYMENNANFAINSRVMQEQREEKNFGNLSEESSARLTLFQESVETMDREILALMEQQDIPFLATDRNILNLPGVGKSLSFRVIGITRYGRRILEFDHDPHRRHSPVIGKMGKVIIIESKSVSEYLEQLTEMGENPEEYNGLYGYSIGETEQRQKIYEYPPYSFKITEEMTNLDIL